MEDKKHSEKKSETITMEKATLWKIAAGVFGLLFIVTLINGNTPATAPTQPTAGDDGVPTVSADMKKIADTDAFKGEANAPVTIIEFSDYECPFCQRFWAQTLPSINDAYIKTGKVKFVYRDFPLSSIHAQAQKSAEAAECAGEQGKYYDMHDKLFTSGVAGGVASFKQYAKDLGLDSAKFDNCLDSGKFAAEVQKDTQDGSSVGIQGTPGFLIGTSDGKSATLISGAYPFATFQQTVDALLE